jgi:hypothetical protein
MQDVKMDSILAMVLIGMLAACTADGFLEPDPEVAPATVTVQPMGTELVMNGVVLTVRAEEAGDSVRVVAEVENTRSESIAVAFGACAVNVLVFDDPSLEGAPVWTHSTYMFEEYRVVCLGGPLIEGWLNPGASISPPYLRARFAPPAVPGDSLPDGTYFLAARIDVGLDSHRPNRYRLPIGTLRVERP